MSESLFIGRTLAIATKHHKETVIAPLCEFNLGVVCKVPTDLNTDQLGTFCGEVKRRRTPIENARQKCLMAMEQTGLNLAIASEGSFGLHPTLFFAPADDEIVLLLDRKNNLEIVGRKLTSNTNFGGALAKTMNEALAFANDFQFGSHGLILRRSKHDLIMLRKGITRAAEFEKGVEDILAENGSVWIETDMRALYNPTRMEVIKAATENLIEKALSLCPECKCPGFSVTKIIPGLPCAICAMPTASTLAYQYECQCCQYTSTKDHPKNRLTESPEFCDFCNP